MSGEEISRYIPADESWEIFQSKLADMGVSLKREDGTFKSLFEILDELAYIFEEGEVSFDINE